VAVVALVFNPISLFIFTILIQRHKKKKENSAWASHEGRGC